ncbi:hypothetical protein MSG71_09015 [Acinetobacter baumannii]|nr:MULTISPECIES: hypothetical protein [Acinetobacter calcoaceticus/baumannii complex]EXB85643.1 hypothetical protein J542_0557 [Acinetobacter baumannii 299505]EXS45588.1 hypothetical protein J660_2497 [Acinetobacter sp. 88816]UUG68550.1 hypothetical protein [Acinetobacter phage TCUAN1]EKF46112.1 hypothetical protein W9I_03260 [Acinetobacter nosocomialis Ab22222]MCP9172038.1 hypothetical protein [Acinetobacter baumannii]
MNLNSELVKGMTQIEFEQELARLLRKDRDMVSDQMQKDMEALQKLNSGNYVIVPKEPTQRMLNAGHVAMNPVKGSDVHSGTNQKRRECYKAMIRAYQEYGDQ